MIKEQFRCCNCVDYFNLSPTNQNDYEEELYNELRLLKENKIIII